jgi:predicted transcriptional regulator
MINLDDRLIRYFDSLTKKELIIYLMLNRYLTENQSIPLDHVMEVVHQTIFEYSNSINRLIELGLIEIEHTKEKPYLKDQLTGNRGEITLKNKNRTGGEQHYIYNIIDNKNKKVNSLLGLKGLEREKGNVTIRFRRVLHKIYNLDSQRRRVELVNYFADKINSMYGAGVVTPEWRRGQLSCAKRILKEHNFNLEEWKEAIDYFSVQEFWSDKLKSLKQVESNLHQFIAKKGAKKSKRKIQTIK